MHIYTFRNQETGETVRAESSSRNNAARQLGIQIVYGQKLPEPWKAVACHTPSGALVWNEEQL